MDIEARSNLFSVDERREAFQEVQAFLNGKHADKENIRNTRNGAMKRHSSGGSAKVGDLVLAKKRTAASTKRV